MIFGDRTALRIDEVPRRHVETALFEVELAVSGDRIVEVIVDAADFHLPNGGSDCLAAGDTHIMRVQRGLRGEPKASLLPAGNQLPFAEVEGSSRGLADEFSN